MIYLENKKASVDWSLKWETIIIGENQRKLFHLLSISKAKNKVRLEVGVLKFQFLLIPFLRSLLENKLQ